MTTESVQSIISVFPSDILSLIFQYTYPPPLFDGKRHHPTTDSLRSLGLVSRHWHRTLMATSELWTSIIIPMEGADTSKYAAGLASLVDKTRYRPLSLSLDYSGLVNLNDDILIHSSVDAVLLNNLERIENLQLVQPPRAWFSNLHHLDRIDHLSLFQVEGDPLRLSLDCIPSLSKFTLADANIRLANHCLVTSLTLIGVPLNNCFNIIANCPKLTMLHLEDYDTFGRRALDAVLPKEAFPPQPLEVLIWKVFSTMTFLFPWQTAILNHLEVGSLQSLAWHQPPSWTLVESSQGRRHWRAMSNFFARLPPTLTCLEFIQDSEDILGRAGRLVETLRNDQGITSLKFTECHASPILCILQTLALSERYPRLETITMGKIIWSDLGRNSTMEEVLSEWLLKTLKRRLTPTKGRLALYLKHNPLNEEEEGWNYDWLNCIKREIVEMKQRGCQIQVFMASRPVEWL